MRTLKNGLFALLITLILSGSLFAALGQAQSVSPVHAPGAKLVPPPPQHPVPDFPLPPPAYASHPAADNTDLSIHFIERTPHYQRYCLDYEHDAPELCAGTENEKRFPDPGELVTLTARIANQGQITATMTAYTWTVDGVIANTGVTPELAPMAESDLIWDWPWQTGAHTITLELAASAGEAITANNRLDHRTDAHYLEILVHPYFVDAFAQRPNLIGSHSFADWLQAQLAQMNQRLAAAAYPDLSGGLPDRVRIDVITATEEVGGDIVSGALDYDGRWTFRTETNYKSTPIDEAWESAQNYARTYASGIDWGLIHELAHQLGVIDLYQLNVSPSAGNEVVDATGLPLLSGFYWQYPGLMGGDDVRPYDATHFSEHTALALSTNSGYRRGYFGEYLFDLPLEVRLDVRTNLGDLLPGAEIAAFQTRFGVVDAAAVFTGVTDAQGRFTLPNRPVSPTLTTATGHGLAPNPFGLIDVVGRNGQLLLRVRQGAQEFFLWLPITELNKAVWQGESVYTIRLDTHLSNEISPAPPLQVRTEGSVAHLSWQPEPDAIGYNIYRSLWPEFTPFRLAASVTDTSVSIPLTRTARFALTAIYPDGSESNLSEIARAELVNAPAALAWEPNSAWSESGQLLALDSHNGAMLRLLPPEENQPMRWVGRMGSEHIGMVGAVAATLGPGEVLGTALGTGQRAYVLDKDLQPLNWIGWAGVMPSPLDRPGGLALAGPPFTVDLALSRPDDDALLLLPFDGSLNDPDGGGPELAQNVGFAAGRFGKAVEISDDARLHYSAAGRFDETRGGVEFWLKPAWPGTDKNHHILLDVGDSNRQPDDDSPGFRLRIAQENGGLYVWVTNFDDFSKAAWGDVSEWQAGEWHHIAATWGEQRLNLHVDGRLLWAESLPVPIAGMAQSISIGAGLDGSDVADAVFDSLRISRNPRLGNSDEFRVLVSEQQRAEVKVLDLMGNPISSWTPDDDGPHAFAALAIDSTNGVWLADRVTRQIYRFDFDGDVLVQAGALDLTFEDAPSALAVGPNDILAIADGDRILLLDPDQPQTDPIVWIHPNDGSHGPFSQPAALAFGPDGDLAVAERGSRRISFIRRPFSRYYLPLIKIDSP
ncbi:MAG: hypothetical protein J5I90_09175 [Caldilineales bacterium]|nr:hypothetical protein [Caldilineales bacterium]